VKPNEVAKSGRSRVQTSRLLRPEKMLSFATLRMPVMTALKRWGVALQPRREEGAEEVEDAGRVAVGVGRVDGRVVLVEEEHDLFPVGAVEVLGQVPERIAEDREVRGAVEDLLVPDLLVRGEHAGVEQGPVLLEEPVEPLLDHPPRMVEAVGLDVLEREEDDRVPLEVGAVCCARLPDREVGEEW
jgi:hypothetical protein